MERIKRQYKGQIKVFREPIHLVFCFFFLFAFVIVWEFTPLGGVVVLCVHVVCTMYTLNSFFWFTEAYENSYWFWISFDVANGGFLIYRSFSKLFSFSFSYINRMQDELVEGICLRCTNPCTWFYEMLCGCSIYCCFFHPFLFVRNVHHCFVCIDWKVLEKFALYGIFWA